VRWQPWLRNGIRCHRHAVVGVQRMRWLHHLRGGHACVCAQDRAVNQLELERQAQDNVRLRINALLDELERAKRAFKQDPKPSLVRSIKQIESSLRYFIERL